LLEDGEMTMPGDLFVEEAVLLVSGAEGPHGMLTPHTMEVNSAQAVSLCSSVATKSMRIQPPSRYSQRGNGYEGS
jgi:hypothetical protein